MGQGMGTVNSGCCSCCAESSLQQRKDTSAIRSTLHKRILTTDDWSFGETLSMTGDCESPSNTGLSATSRPCISTSPLVFTSSVNTTFTTLSTYAGTNFSYHDQAEDEEECKRQQQQRFRTDHEEGTSPESITAISTTRSLPDSLRRSGSVLEIGIASSPSLDSQHSQHSQSRPMSLAMSMSESVDVELAEESIPSHLGVPIPTKRKKTMETIQHLMTRKIPAKVYEVLGDRSLYEIPQQNPALFHIERDLRKIKVSFLDLVAERDEREFAKMAILKHYKSLSAIYRRYCKIGGDSEWMTLRGWTSLLRDCDVIQHKSKSNLNKKYSEIFHEVYSYHSDHVYVRKKSVSMQSKSYSKRTRHHRSYHKQPSLSSMYGETPMNDKDPWTGQWVLLQNEDHNDYDGDDVNHYRHDRKLKFEFTAKDDDNKRSRFKFRKMGDRKIIGCIDSMEDAVIGGTLDDTNFKMARLEIAYKPQQRLRTTLVQSRRTWHCTIRPPRSLLDTITMEVQWEEKNDGSAAVKRGHFRLIKDTPLDVDDEELPLKRYVGLCRHEFFDALLCVAEMNRGGGHHDSDFVDSQFGSSGSSLNLYRLFDDFAVHRLNANIFSNIVDLKEVLNVENGEIERRYKLKLQRHTTTLIKLFKKYSNLGSYGVDQCLLAQDQWCAMAMELCDPAERYNRSLWKHGGKPTMELVIQCFVLCKEEEEDHVLIADEINFVSFQRCLLYFAAFVFRHRRDAKYVVPSMTKRVDLVLKWCQYLNKQKKASMIRSESFRKIKRTKQKKRKNIKLQTSSAPLGDVDRGLMKSLSPKLGRLRCSSMHIGV